MKKSYWYFCAQVGVTPVARGAQRRGGGRGVISESQTSQNHSAWPPVSEEGEKVNTPAMRFHFLDLYASLQIF